MNDNYLNHLTNIIKPLVNNNASFETIDKSVHPELYKNYDKYNSINEYDYDVVESERTFMFKSNVICAFNVSVNNEFIGFYYQKDNGLFNKPYICSDGTIFQDFGWLFVRKHFITIYLTKFKKVLS